MSLIKHGEAIVDGVWTPSKTSSLKQASDNLPLSEDIPEDFKFDPNKVYSSVRAISARINDNEDGFDREELLGSIVDPSGNQHPPHNSKFGYVTFRGKNNHIDHANQPELGDQDPRHIPRGKILWSWYHENPMNAPVMRRGTEDPVVKAAGTDSWVRLLMENDRRQFPLLCHYIEEGVINKVSMGCEILNSQCSVCGNTAHHAFQYCGHVRPEGRGQVFSAAAESPYVTVGVLEAGDPIVAFEKNHGLQFFEQSWILETQADPTAVLLDQIRGEPGMSFKELEAAKKKAYKLTSYYKNKDAVAKEGESTINIDGVDVEKLQNEVEENTEGMEMDYERPPHEQGGKFFPAAPFPCSALVTAQEANPDYPMDTTIDVSKCVGCIYNKVDESGAVDCNFPDVVREGGKDPLPTGFEPVSDQEESSGFKTEEGEEVDLLPNLGRPPHTDEKESSYNPEYPYVEVTPKFAAEMEQMEMFPETSSTPQSDQQLFDTTEEYDQGTWTPEHSVSVTIPHADSDGNVIDEEFFNRTVKWVREQMAMEFGGTSVQTRDAGDFYDSKDDKVVSEDDLAIITSNTDDLEHASEYTEELARYLQHHMAQSSIEYSIDGKPYYTSNAFKKDNVPLQEGESATIEDLQREIEELKARLNGGDQGSGRATG